MTSLTPVYMPDPSALLT